MHFSWPSFLQFGAKRSRRDANETQQRTQQHRGPRAARIPVAKPPPGLSTHRGTWLPADSWVDAPGASAREVLRAETKSRPGLPERRSSKTATPQPKNGSREPRSPTVAAPAQPAAKTRADAPADADEHPAPAASAPVGPFPGILRPRRNPDQTSLRSYPPSLRSTKSTQTMRAQRLGSHLNYDTFPTHLRGQAARRRGSAESLVGGDAATSDAQPLNFSQQIAPANSQQHNAAVRRQSANATGQMLQDERQASVAIRVRPPTPPQAAQQAQGRSTPPPRPPRAAARNSAAAQAAARGQTDSGFADEAELAALWQDAYSQQERQAVAKRSRPNSYSSAYGPPLTPPPHTALPAPPADRTDLSKIASIARVWALNEFVYVPKIVRQALQQSARGSRPSSPMSQSSTNSRPSSAFFDAGLSREDLQLLGSFFAVRSVEGIEPRAMRRLAAIAEIRDIDAVRQAVHIRQRREADDKLNACLLAPDIKTDVRRYTSMMRQTIVSQFSTHCVERPFVAQVNLPTVSRITYSIALHRASFPGLPELQTWLEDVLDAYALLAPWLAHMGLQVAANENTLRFNGRSWACWSLTIKQQKINI